LMVTSLRELGLNAGAEADSATTIRNARPPLAH